MIVYVVVSKHNTYYGVYRSNIDASAMAKRIDGGMVIKARV